MFMNKQKEINELHIIIKLEFPHRTRNGIYRQWKLLSSKR